MIHLPKGGGRPILTPRDTPAFDHVADAYPMPSVGLGLPPVSDGLYHGYEDVDVVPAELYTKYDVKRGLRNADGSGVLVGLTTISNVHGYNKTPHGVEPDEGDLIYRGYRVADLIGASQAEDRFGYEEVAYLLIAGKLPTREELDDFCARIDARKQLPEGYLGIFPRATYSHNIMNVLQRATLLLYAFDPNPDDTSPTHEIDVALSLLGRWPRTAAVAHAAHKAELADEKLMVPPVREGYTMAETVLDVLRDTRWQRPSWTSCAATTASPTRRPCSSTSCSSCTPSTAAATTPRSPRAYSRPPGPTPTRPTRPPSARSRAPSTVAPTSR